ncbi:MAG: CPBP family intramembrane glutamic endopeptidase [Bacteroidota bacterium]
MDLVLNAALLAALTAPFLLIVLLAARERRWAPALLVLGLIALDDLAVTLPYWAGLLDVFGGNWNWDGKAYSLVWALAFVAFGPLSSEEAGLTLRQRAGSAWPAALVTAALTAASFGLGVLFGGGPPDVETVAFQLTMPGLAEEVVYRGVLIGLLHRAFVGAGLVARVGPTLVTAVAFGLVHGLSVEAGVPSFEWLFFSYTFVGGLAYGWLRERTGSVAFPVLAHSLGNTIALVGAAIAG